MEQKLKGIFGGSMLYSVDINLNGISLFVPIFKNHLLHFSNPFSYHRLHLHSLLNSAALFLAQFSCPVVP